MPIYEYCCDDCEQIFEEWQRNHDEQTVPCPVCGSEAHRIISNTSFVLKGSGWYVTDYAKGPTSHGSAKSDVAGGGASGGNGDGAAGGEKKPEAASATTGGSTPPKAETPAPKAGSSPAQS